MWWAITIMFSIAIINNIIISYFEHKENIEAIKNKTSLNRINKREWCEWNVQKKNGIVVELKKWDVNGCYYDDSEIEKAKDDFRFFNEGDYITKEMTNSKEKIFEYIEQLELENIDLKTQRDYYKREYSLYNKTLEEAGKVLTKRSE